MEQARVHSLELSFTARHHEDAFRTLQLQVARWWALHLTAARQQRVAPQVTAAVTAVMAVTAKKARARWRDTMVNASARVVATARHTAGRDEASQGSHAWNGSGAWLHPLPRACAVIAASDNAEPVVLPRVWRHDSFVPHLAMKDTSVIAELIRMPC